MVNPEIITKMMAAAKIVGYGGIPPFEENKWFTTGAFDLIIPGTCDPGTRFEMLKELCRRYDEVRGDPKFLSGYLHILRTWIHSVNTNEMPQGIDIILLENPEVTQDIKEFYRL